jgi:hypothetical protein
LSLTPASITSRSSLARNQEKMRLPRLRVITGF